MGQIGDFEFILSLEEDDEDDLDCADDVDNMIKYGNGDDGNDSGDDGKTILIMTMKHIVQMMLLRFSSNSCLLMITQ